MNSLAKRKNTVIAALLLGLGLTVGFYWQATPVFSPPAASLDCVEAPRAAPGPTAEASPQIASYISALSSVTEPLEHLYQQVRQDYGHLAEVTYRRKSLASLQEKLRVKALEKGEYPLESVTDLGGIRLVFSDIRTLYETGHRIELQYPVVKRRDYIVHPNKRGYRSLHIVVEFQGKAVEIQLRTQGMHRWNNWHHDLVYKNEAHIKSHYGKEVFEEIKNYSYRISQYAFLLETGIITPAPMEPPALRILWDLASPKERLLMKPNGAPDFSFLIKGVPPKKNHYP